MDVSQNALATLQRIRTGGQQTVVVQHVQVSGGGQAVIAGSMRTGKRGKVRGRQGDGVSNDSEVPGTAIVPASSAEPHDTAAKISNGVRIIPARLGTVPDLSQ